MQSRCTILSNVSMPLNLLSVHWLLCRHIIHFSLGQIKGSRGAERETTRLHWNDKRSYLTIFCCLLIFSFFPPTNSVPSCTAVSLTFNLALWYKISRELFSFPFHKSWRLKWFLQKQQYDLPKTINPSVPGAGAYIKQMGNSLARESWLKKMENRVGPRRKKKRFSSFVLDSKPKSNLFMLVELSLLHFLCSSICVVY